MQGGFIYMPKEWEALLKHYLLIWNNRSIQLTENESAKDILLELIRREIMDENTHPRARKGKYEKFFLSIGRISESGLADEDKTALTEIYLLIMKETP
jgi:hypothetical protein